MNARRAFMLVAGALLTLAMLALVVGPALQRGGLGELLLVVGLFFAVLLFERWLRYR